MSYVLKLCGWYPSRVDAFNGDFVQRHARAIATQVPVVVLFAVKDPTPGNKNIELCRKQDGQLDEWIFYYPRRAFADALWSQWYYLRILSKAIIAIEREYGRPKLIHVNIVWRAAIWALRLRKWKIPIVITENSTEYQPGALVNIRTASVAKQLIFKQIFESAKRFISVTHQLGQMVQSRYGNIPYSVVPNVVDTQQFFPLAQQKNDGKFRLIHVSTMNYQKNIEGVLAVLDQLVSQYQTLICTMIGPLDTDLEQWWQATDRRREAIHFTGWLPYTAVATAIQQADALFLFSRYENLPCVILEAFCAGLPVVSTDVGGIAEVINEENGILVANEDRDALLHALESMITGHKKFDNAAIAASASAKYNYATVGRAFMSAYAEAGIIWD